MVKALTAGMETHLNLNTTNLVTCWFLKRTDNVIFAFTDHTRDLDIDLGDGNGEQTYLASSGYNRTNIANDAELTVDNLEVIGALDNAAISDADLKAGFFDFAVIKVFMVNYLDLIDGEIKMRRGWLGEVTITPTGKFQAELRGLSQITTRRMGELYSKDCRADLGDSRCKIPLGPAEVARSIAYTVGDLGFVKAQELTSMSVTNPGGESGSTTGWTNEVGTLRASQTTPDPFVGSWYLEGGAAEADTKARQDLAVDVGDEAEIDASNMSVQLRWWQISGDTLDDGQMTIRFLDGGDAQIGSETFASLISPATWVERVLRISVPALTRKVRIAVHSVRNNGSENTAGFDEITVRLYKTNPTLADFGTRIYKVTTAGTSGIAQPDFDTTLDNTTVDGGAVFTAQEAWARFAIVVSVSDARRIFKVTELTPNTLFITDWFNQGHAKFTSGDLVGRSYEIKNFVADDDITIEQEVAFNLDTPLDIQVGDTMEIYPGCDKTMLGTHGCKVKFDNALNFVGEPYVPGPDFLLQYPDARN